MTADGKWLRSLRLGAMTAGSVLLLLAMTLWSDSPWPRDLLWTIGVALLILALVANWLARREEASRGREPTGGDPSD